MAVFDRLSIRVAAVGAGLCGIALALSPGVAQAGGYDCLQTTAGEARLRRQEQAREEREPGLRHALRSLKCPVCQSCPVRRWRRLR